MDHSALTEDHIATLTDVARSAGVDVSEARKPKLDELVAAGFVAPADGKPGPRYKLTPAGQAVLDARGVGANES